MLAHATCQDATIYSDMGKLGSVQETAELPLDVTAEVVRAISF